MSSPHNSLEDRLHVLRTRWESYVAQGGFEQFVEFAVTVNSLTEHFNRLRLPGLVRLCAGLENASLARLGEQTTHPLMQQDILALQRQVDTLLSAVATSRAPVVERRDEDPATAGVDVDWIKPRSVWIVAAPDKNESADDLGRQFHFFGFRVFKMLWGKDLPADDAPLAVLFIPDHDGTQPEELNFVARVRAACPASQMFYLGIRSEIESIIELMRAGIDVTISAEDQSLQVLNRVLDLVQSSEQEKYRVLVVEDSRVAATLIQRTLAEHGIDSRAIRDPGTLLKVLESYRPDLILMDMYMPHFNGVEATRVLRQIAAYRALPIVYLSAESDVALQVEALRLGGDQFLVKPFNPVFLSAVVKTKIERFRENQRSSRLDGLTGLLNHTTAKSRLKVLVGDTPADAGLTVAMIDIDHFKAVNDTYGHPVGDQVIRSLAWLLKGRLRTSDLIGRYGGEEFLIALPDVGQEEARSVIDRIRRDFAALPHLHPGGVLYTTFSAGLACLPGFETAAGLTEAADSALLQAKRLGRNRVEMASQLKSLSFLGI